jgi:hypothetical protein
VGLRWVSKQLPKLKYIHLAYRQRKPVCAEQLWEANGTLIKGKGQKQGTSCSKGEMRQRSGKGRRARIKEVLQLR